MNKLVKILISLPLLMFVFSSLNAALTIEITEGTEGALPIAVVPFDTSKVASKLVADIAQIVSNDLNRSGVLTVLSRKLIPAKPHYSQQVDYPLWRSAEQDYLVVGRILEKSAGQFEIQFQLLDVLKQKQLIGYSLQSSKRELRASAHKISDLIYEKKFKPPNNLLTYLGEQLRMNEYPVKAGNHIEDRGTLLNFSIVGRNKLMF